MKKPEIVIRSDGKIVRDGIVLQKGKALNEEWLLGNQKTVYGWLDFFWRYPDAYFDAIAPVNSPFNFFPYQRFSALKLNKAKVGLTL